MARRGNKPESDGKDDRERRAAWKYVGYPGFSRFMASSNDCLALRKFSTLNIRVLLKLQNDIVEMERRMDEMDNFTMNLPASQGGCASFRLDADTPREELLEEMATALKDYKAPEREFLDYDRDLLTVRTARRTYFGRWMEALGLASITGFSATTSKPTTRYYNRNTWKDLGGLWLLLCVLAMLIGPLWASRYSFGGTVRLAAVTAFTIAFSLLVVLGTTLKASHAGIWVAGYFTQLILVFGLMPTLHETSASHVASVPPASAATTITMTATVSNLLTTTVMSTISAQSQTPDMTMLSSSSTDTTGFPSSTSDSQTTSGTPSATPLGPAHAYSGLSNGAIAGIVVGIAAVFALLAGVIWYILRRRISHRKHVESEALGYEASRSDHEAALKKIHELAGKERQPSPPPVAQIARQSVAYSADEEGRAPPQSEANSSAAEGKGRLHDQIDHPPEDAITIASASSPTSYPRDTKGKRRLTDASPAMSENTTLYERSPYPGPIMSPGSAVRDELRTYALRDLLAP